MPQPLPRGVAAYQLGAPFRSFSALLRYAGRRVEQRQRLLRALRRLLVLRLAQQDGGHRTVCPTPPDPRCAGLQRPRCLGTPQG